MQSIIDAVCLVFILALCHGASVPSGNECELSRIPYTMADPEQCDAFFRCDNGFLTSELCDDGLVYHETDNNCDMPQRVDCTGREILQPAKGSGNCPRLNGLFHHQEFCDQYYYCRVGLPLLVTCPIGLVYDIKSGVCEYPDVALREGCMPEDVLGFQCPLTSNTTEQEYNDQLRFPKEDDCRYFFRCLKNGYPRLGGCESNHVFNPNTGSCDKPRNVAGCENYYNDSEKEEEEDE